jgi:hypothetical protein
MGQMHSNIIVITQPRCGGHMTLKVFEKVYPTHNNLYEQFDWQKQKSVQELLDEAMSKQPFVLKLTWWDVKDDFETIAQIPAKFYYLKRTDAFEMVASSYLAHVSGIYHRSTEQKHQPLDNVEMPVDFLEHFFDKTQPGGWHYMLEEHNPLLKHVNYETLEYSDQTTPSNMYEQITGEQKSIEINFVKLYTDKSHVIANADQVKAWIEQNV